MRHRNGWLYAALLISALPLAACSQAPSEGVLAGHVPPVTVAAIDGTELKLVTLIPRSAERLGILTTPVTQEQVAGRMRTVMPYAALLYDEHGSTWAFTNPEGLAFVRHAVTVDFIEGDLAVLSDGPAPGTKVVTAGAAELYGAETGVGGGH